MSQTRLARLIAPVVSAAVLVLALVSPAAADSKITPSAVAPPVSAGSGSNWATYGGNLFNQRFSALDQINAGNVHRLGGVCTFHTTENGVERDLLQASSFEASPIVIDGIMYLSGPQNQVWALDATTCKLIWKYIPELFDINLLPLCCGQVNRGVAVGDGKVFIAQLDAKLVALDQRDGKVLWSVEVADPRAGYSETMAPLFVQPPGSAHGLVVVGVSGAEYEIRGRVTAYDAATGALRWRTTTTDEAVPNFDGTAGNDQHAGGSVWQMPAVDPALNRLYIAVGNPSPDLDGSVRPGPNPFTESVMALDISTGERIWTFQEIHHDIWDLDTVSPNILFDVSIGGVTRKGLGQTGKTGWIYLLDRTNGTPLVGIDEKPVPQLAIQKTEPTQPFPRGDAFVPQVCPEPINFRGRTLQPHGIFTPFDVAPLLICPGANGGSEWSPSSFSPATNLMYTCGIHQPMVWTRNPDHFQLEQPVLRLGSAFVKPANARTWGTFTGIDVRTNTIKWQRGGPTDTVFNDEFGGMCIGGSLATAGGLTFVGEGNGHFDAFNAATGELLWQFQAGAGVNAPPISYSVNGRQFVAVAAGGNRQLDYPRGDTLWVFALDGQLGPAPAPVKAQPTPVADKQVKIEDFAYEPQVIEVRPGTTVIWENEDDTAHTVTSDRDQLNPNNPYPFSSPLLDHSDKFQFTFANQGTFPYHCNPHPFMTGKVIVTPDAPAEGRVVPLSQLATGEDPDAAPELMAAVAANMDDDSANEPARLMRVTLDPTGQATVQFALRDLGSDLSQTREAAMLDALNILRAVQHAPEHEQISTTTILGTYAVETSPGVARQMPVLRGVVSNAKADTLDWDSLTPAEVPGALDVWWVHPALDVDQSAGARLAVPVSESGTGASLDSHELRAQVDLSLAHVNEALIALSSNEVRIARSQFRQFFDRWDDVAGDLAGRYPERYAPLDTEIERVEVALLHRLPEDTDTARASLLAVRSALVEIANDLEANP